MYVNIGKITRTNPLSLTGNKNIIFNGISNLE